MAMPKLQVIGGGKMGEALLAGLLAGGWATAAELRVVEKLPARAAELRGRVPRPSTSAPTPTWRTGHVLAVKPGGRRDRLPGAGRHGLAARRCCRSPPGSRSAAGGALPPGTPVVRAMPNTPALVGAGAAAVAAGPAAGEADLAWAEEVLGAVGRSCASTRRCSTP